MPDPEPDADALPPDMLQEAFSSHLGGIGPAWVRAWVRLRVPSFLLCASVSARSLSLSLCSLVNDRGMGEGSDVTVHSDRPEIDLYSEHGAGRRA
jgi:hypothetical protein